jgi:RNA polymerase sigma-70 factor, ECF subfamily
MRREREQNNRGRRKRGATPAAVDQLIEQIRRGDRRAFGRLVAELEPFVSGSSLKVCRDRDIASENVQDTFINVYRKLHQFDGTSKFTTWIYSIVVNNCRMKRRRRLIDEATVSTEATGHAPLDRAHAAHDAGSSPDGALLLDELQKVLGRAVEKLPEEYRSVFVLRDVEGRSNEETAEELGLSVAAVKSRLHRARGRVREHVEEYLDAGS